MRFNDKRFSGRLVVTPAAVDDSVIDENKLWSSRKTVDTLAILESRSGETVAIDDAAALPLQGLHVYGKTTQDGTPKPDAPVAMVNVVDSGSIVVSITDGTEENVQTIAVPTPNGLAGIPVASGGNYTDANGQQWLCDEIDFARGVYVQNIYTRVFDGTEAFYASPITSGADHYRYSIKDSNHKGYDSGIVFDGYVSHYGKTYANGGFLGKAPNCVAIRSEDINFYVYEATEAEFKAFLAENPVTLMCPLAEPDEKALTAEQLAVFADAALHMYKPHTSAYTDAGTGLQLDYVADAKAYIDNKITALQNAIISTGANI